MTKQQKEHLPYWLGFNKVNGIGPARLRALLAHFGDVTAAWQASPEALHECGLDRRALKSLLTTRECLDLGAEVARLEKLGIQCLTWEDEDYPESLRQLDDAPPLIYVFGTLTSEDDRACAIVGTRRVSAYGREVTRSIAADLAHQGITIVSGLARGIDGIAHQAALDAGGRTIAVLGSGLDVIYPSEHRQLAKRIAASGAVISEYPLGTQPEASNFPPRNRIISGLSRGVLVTEAGEVSGALITADFALIQGRHLFSVPGNIFQHGSRGTNDLIQQGATMVTTALDVLDELELAQVVEQQAEIEEALTEVLPDDPVERRLLECLSSEPCHLDDVSQGVGLPIAVVSSTLSLMELKGLVQDVGGLKYVAAHAWKVSSGG